MTDVPIRKINESNEISIPPFAKEHMGTEVGDFVELEKGANNTIVMRKWVKTTAAFFIAALALFAVVMAGGHQGAYAQQAVSNSTVATTPPPVAAPQPPSTNTVESITFAGEAAYFPLRVEFTYPAGINPIWNVSKGSVATVYSESSTVGVGGITTKTWSTGMADTFTIRFGEHYPAAIDQIAIVRVYGNNSNPVPEWIIPIKGDSFERQIKLVTTPKPHVPTPEELAAPVLSKLDQSIQLQQKNSQTLDTVNITVGLLSGWISGGFGLHVIGALFTFAGAIILFSLRRQIVTYLVRPKPRSGATT